MGLSTSRLSNGRRPSGTTRGFVASNRALRGRTVVYELSTESGSWPYHYHTANEEAIYVISGAGTIVAVRGNSWPPIDGR